MSDNKERIDHILTQDVTDNKDSAKLNSLLYRDKAKEDTTKKSKKEREQEEALNNPNNTSMLSFMWGDDGGSKKRKRAEAKKKKEAAKLSQSTDTQRQQGKTIVRESQQAVEITREGISLQLGESEDGKLKLKVSTGKRKDISKKRLAKIAMNAIIKELKKEE